MKKCIFAILFFIGCFFVGLTTNYDYVGAVSSEILPDPYDSRKITITLNDISAKINLIKLHEIEYCNPTETGCQTYKIDEEDISFRILNTTDYNVSLDSSTTTTINHVISSDNDGIKYFFVEPFVNDTVATKYYHFFEYKLSTLLQRVVINADANGKPLHEYKDGRQYISVRRAIPLSIKLLEDEKQNVYSDTVYICEVYNEQSDCKSYPFGDDPVYFAIFSYGDGLKKVDIYIVKKNQTIDESRMLDELKNKATKISKQIYLDTIGPEITSKTDPNWEWAIVESGKVYQAADVTCKDAVFADESCVVTNDANIVKIDYTTDKYQFVTYEATDWLGNTTVISAKVKVEVLMEKPNYLPYIIISVAVFLVTLLILGWILIRNHEKKKKLSYI